MHREIFHDCLSQLDKLTDFSIDLAPVPVYQELPFRHLFKVFKVSISIEDFEGALIAGAAMIQAYDEVSESENPDKEQILEWIEADFSHGSYLLKQLLGEIN